MKAVTLSRHFTTKQQVMLVTPFVLTATMVVVFQAFVAWWGMPWGWLAAFLVYWLGWCLALPLWALGGTRELIALFRAPRPAPRPALLGLLILPLAFPLLLRFIPKLAETNATVLVVSLVIGIAIGVSEEILWRGVYVRLFSDNFWLGYVYPSIAFGIWHIAPQSIAGNTQPGGALSFIVYATLLGLLYGLYTWKTGSIRDTTLSHIVHDTLGLSGFLFRA